MGAVLIVTSQRGDTDAQETLRIHDLASAFLARGWCVDVLVPRVGALLDAAVDRKARLFKPLGLPFCSHLPDRASWRRLFASFMTFFRGYSLVGERNYSLLIGIDDGMQVVRWLDRATISRLPYICEMRKPFLADADSRSLVSKIVKYLERKAVRHASVVVFSDEATMNAMDGLVPRSRMSLIPDPRVDMEQDGFTIADFEDAISRVAGYAVTKAERGL